MVMVRRLLVLGVATLLMACSGGGTSTDRPSDGEAATSEALGSSGTEFTIKNVRVGGMDADVRPVGMAYALFVGPADVRLFTGCHDVVAGYALDLEGDVTLSDQHGPRAGCDGQDLEQADRLVQVVSTGARWIFIGDDLVARKGPVEVTFAPGRSA
jgi:hypothetical protein